MKVTSFGFHQLVSIEVFWENGLVDEVGVDLSQPWSEKSGSASGAKSPRGKISSIHLTSSELMQYPPK